MNISPRDQNGLILVTNVVPIFCILYCLVSTFEIALEEVSLQCLVFVLEGLTYRLLLIAIPSNVCACVGGTEMTFSLHFIEVNAHAIGCEVCSGCRRLCHFIVAVPAIRNRGIRESTGEGVNR